MFWAGLKIGDLSNRLTKSEIYNQQISQLNNLANKDRHLLNKLSELFKSDPNVQKKIESLVSQIPLYKDIGFDHQAEMFSLKLNERKSVLNGILSSDLSGKAFEISFQIMTLEMDLYREQALASNVVVY